MLSIFRYPEWAEKNNRKINAPSLESRHICLLSVEMNCQDFESLGENCLKIIQRSQWSGHLALSKGRRACHFKQISRLFSFIKLSLKGKVSQSRERFYRIYLAKKNI